MNSTKEQNNRETTGRTNPNLALWLTEIYRCGFTDNGYNAAMKKALAHLPELTAKELKYLARCVEIFCDQTEASCEKKMESFV